MKSIATLFDQGFVYTPCFDETESEALGNCKHR